MCVHCDSPATSQSHRCTARLVDRSVDYCDGCVWQPPKDGTMGDCPLDGTLPWNQGCIQRCNPDFIVANTSHHPYCTCGASGGPRLSARSVVCEPCSTCADWGIFIFVLMVGGPACCGRFAIGLFSRGHGNHCGRGCHGGGKLTRGGGFGGPRPAQLRGETRGNGAPWRAGRDCGGVGRDPGVGADL